jgi:glutathione S-transferase
MNNTNSGIGKLILHHYPATRSARVKWILHEVIGDAFETVAVDLYAGVQYSDEFMAKNPNHNVPVLDIEFNDGTSMTMLESAAMVAFLADAYPEKQLAPIPGPSHARADYLQMLQFGAVTMDMMLWQIRIHEHVLPKTERDERTVARYRNKFMTEVEPQLAARLAHSEFICGDTFTAADCVIGHNITWARGYGMCQDELFRAYLSRISKRPAFRAAFADASSFNPQPPKPPSGKISFNG